MRIACLQFNPSLGNVQRNIQRADSLLSASSSKLHDLDLLVLPELAFTGYNFPSLSAISPYLEPTSSGPSTTWALATAKRLNCAVSVGYPEITTPSTSPSPPTAPLAQDTSPRPATNPTPPPAPPHRYNSTVTVSPTGTILAHYRKTFLYYTDSTWASPSPSGFWAGSLATDPENPARPSSLRQSGGGGDQQPLLRERSLSKVAMGICMDLNPRDFTAPWTEYEFATHVLRARASLAVLSMAWLTRLSSAALTAHPREPDMETFGYWLARLQPVVDARGRGEVVVVFANRCGEEAGEARYAGTSAVVGVREGRVRVFGVLGRGVEGLLSVDTGARAEWEVEMTE